ncbi:MAG: hypothetical protein ACXVKN_15565, partial [Acidimicrobiia bacterium]
AGQHADDGEQREREESELRLRRERRARTARVILGGFLVKSQPGASDPGRPLSAEAKLALLALALFAVIGVLAGVLRRRERTASAR